MPTPGSSARLKSVWPMPRMNATIEEPKAAPFGARVTFGAWAVTSERLDWLRFSSIWAFTAVMAMGVFSRLCSRN